MFNSPGGGVPNFPWDDLREVFSGCQWMAKVPNVIEILPKIWTIWVRRTNVTDRQMTDGRAIAYSEREHESTFTKNYHACAKALFFISNFCAVSILQESWIEMGRNIYNFVLKYNIYYYSGIAIILLWGGQQVGESRSLWPKGLKVEAEGSGRRGFGGRLAPSH